ncbi:MAG: hypothetical protein IJH13_01810 [Bacilli bacterium]|nr:hypothetical protein [Bacilli bacterium]
MNQKIRYFLILSIVFLGITAISSGMIMPSLSVKGKNIVKLKVVQKRVASSNKLELILKNITQDVNVPLSVEVKDYIENIGSVSDKVLAKLKLDTSLVNIKQPGAYQYTVTYNKRVYVGIVNIKEPDKSLASITLKNITLLINDPVPTDLNSYIKESIPDNAKDKIKLDISKVNNRSAGTYQYTIDYNGKLYTGTVTVYSPQQDPVSKPDKEEKDDSTEVEPVNNE